MTKATKKKTARKIGRPTKLTLDIEARIVQAISAGNYMETAAAYVGISKVTLYKWMRDGARAKSGKKKNFVNAVEKALAVAEMDAVATIKVASGKTWQAAAWHLERSHPDRWGRRAIPGEEGELERTAVSVKELLESPHWGEIKNVVKEVLVRYPGSSEDLHAALKRLVDEEG
jgi:transposase-like protein